MESPKLISFRSLVVESFKLAFKRIDLIVQVIILLALLGTTFYAAVMAGSVVSSATAGGIVVLVGVVVSVAFLVAFVVALFGLGYALVHLEKSLSLYAASKLAWPLIWPIVWVGILLELITSTGYVLFIVPGLLIAIYASMSQYVVYNEPYRGLDAVVRATQMVYGSFWSVLSRYLLIIVVFLLNTAVSGAIGFALYKYLPSTSSVVVAGLAVLGVAFFSFISMQFISAIIILYKSLQEIRPTETFVQDEWVRVRKWYKVAAWLGIIAIIILNRVDTAFEDELPSHEEVEVVEFPLEASL